MKLDVHNSLLFKILVIGCIFLFLKSTLSTRGRIAVSENEFVTVPSWDSSKTNRLGLKMKFLFYWKQWPLTNHGVYDKGLLTKVDTINSTSAVWKHKGYPPKGFGTYRFFINQEDLNKEAVLNFSRVLGACEVWINGKKQITHGNVSKSLDNSKDAIPGLTVDLPEETLLDVMLLVSNSNSRMGGGFPLENTIEEKESSYLMKQRKFAFEGLVTFIILIFGVYQIFSYFSVHKQKYFLYFGLFCVFGGIRQLFVGEAFIYRLFPEVPFEVIQRLRYICFYGGLGFIFLYHNALFPKYYHKRIVQLFTVIPALGIIYVLITPIFYGTYSAPVFHFFGFLNIVAGYWIIIKAIKDKKPFAKSIILNAIVLSVIFTNDMLSAMMLRKTAFIANIGLLAYVFFQMYLNYKIAKEKEKELRNMTKEVQSMNQQMQIKEAEISKLLHESYHHLKSKRDLADNLRKASQDNSISVDKIVKGLRSELLEDNQLNVIRNDIEMLHYDFIQRLKAKAPQLSKTDIETCTYMYMGLSRKEIARLRHISVEAARKSRYRLRKKLELDADVDLENYLKGV